MAAVAALKTDWEAKGYEVILVDAGDATQGMSLVDSTSGEPAITFMNSCGYDLMTVGNHEFDWGLDALAKKRDQAKFPLLSANVVYKDTKELVFEPNKVVELSDGTKVGFFGVTTPSTLTSTNPKNVKDVIFLKDEELYECARKQVSELRDQGCQLVVCVGHLGNQEVGTSGGTSRQVLENVEGIDLFIDGHDHQVVEEEVKGTLLVETGCYLRTCNNNGRGWARVLRRRDLYGGH
ncbi:MAG: metallophosphatase [Atopobiaceae bacterium]|nr:metallophosphatase [Atopobiaceae bacterium]